MENLITGIENINITDICFEHIKTRDNLEFHKALYGDFIVIMIKSDDYRNGYINATKLCQDGGKRLDNWTRLDNSVNLIADFAEFLLSSHVRRADFSVNWFLQTQNLTEEDRLISGTYFHSDVIVHIASWVSNEFAFKVSKIVNSHIVKHFKSHYEGKIAELEEANRKYDAKVKQLKPLAAPYTSNSELDNCLVIFDKMLVSDIFQYYAIRCQKRNLSQAMAKAYSKYPDLEIVYTKYRDPNSIKLFHLARENLKFIGFGNHFNTYLSTDELRTKLENLYDTLLSLE